jgi:hypothetical protein
VQDVVNEVSTGHRGGGGTAMSDVVSISDTKLAADNPRRDQSRPIGCWSDKATHWWAIGNLLIQSKAGLTTAEWRQWLKQAKIP